MSHSLEDTLHSGCVLLMDGAMGTELQRAGLRDGKCGELWNLDHPEKVQAIHQAYANVGAQCLLTNTFQANWLALERRKLESRELAIKKAGYDLARSVAGDDRFVLIDVGPMVNAEELPGEFFCPEAFSHVIPEWDLSDGILLETWSDPGALDAAQILCLFGRWLPAAPILLSLTYERYASGDLLTRSGHPPEWYASKAREYSVKALGVNCGKDIGMDEVIEIVRRYRLATDLPLFARSNAGSPIRVGDRWIYPHTPEKMAARLPELLEAGVSMVGGCCGTTPDHIAAFRPIIDDWNRRHAPKGGADGEVLG